MGCSLYRQHIMCACFEVISRCIHHTIAADAIQSEPSQMITLDRHQQGHPLDEKVHYLCKANGRLHNRRKDRLRNSLSKVTLLSIFGSSARNPSITEPQFLTEVPRVAPLLHEQPLRPRTGSEQFLRRVWGWAVPFPMSFIILKAFSRSHRAATTGHQFRYPCNMDSPTDGKPPLHYCTNSTWNWTHHKCWKNMSHHIIVCRRRFWFFFSSINCFTFILHRAIATNATRTTATRATLSF